MRLAKGYNNRNSVRRPQSYYEAKNVAYRVWAVVGVVLIAAAILYVVGFIMPVIKLLSVGLVVGFFCSAPTNWLEDRGLPRGIAALLSLALLIGLVLLFLALVLPSVFGQVALLLARVPRYVYAAGEYFEDIFERISDGLQPSVRLAITSFVESLGTTVASASRSALLSLSSGVVVTLFDVLSNLFTLFLGLVLAFWFARDYPDIFREISVIAGPKYEKELLVFTTVLSRAVAGYTRSALYTACIAGLLSFGGYLLIEHPYAMLMGIVTATLHIIPVVGVWIALFLSALLAFFTSPMLALWTCIVGVIAMNVADNLIGPLVVQSTVQVHPILSFTAITLGQAVAGIPGMIAAVPLCAALKGSFIYFFELKTGRQLVSENGVMFKSTPFTDGEGDPIPSYDALDDDRFFSSTRLVHNKKDALISNAKQASDAAPVPDDAQALGATSEPDEQHASDIAQESDDRSEQ